MRAMFLAAVLVAFASAQSTERVLHFVHTGDLKNQQEIATVVRTIAMIPDVSLDSSGTLTIRGAAEQLALGEWLVKTLDVETPGNPGEPYLVTGTDEAVRVLYLPETKTVQDFQEVATLVRTIAEIRYVFTYNAQHALVLRANTDQFALTEFLLTEFHQPHPDTKEYRMASGTENVTRVFQVSSANSVQEFQQMATAARTILNVRRVFTLNTPREIAIRGDANQIAAADWFFNQLDHPVQGAASEYRDETQADNVIHLFYLDPSTSIPDLQKTAASIRTNADIRQIFTYDPRRAVAVRGTSSQIEKAKDLLAVR